MHEELVCKRNVDFRERNARVAEFSFRAYMVCTAQNRQDLLRLQLRWRFLSDPLIQKVWNLAHGVASRQRTSSTENLSQFGPGDAEILQVTRFWL